MSRADLSARLLDLAAALPGLAGAHLIEAAHVLATGTAEMRANVVRALQRVAVTLRIAGGPAADVYGMAAELAAEVVR